MQLTSKNCERLLTTNILPFWMDKMVDPIYGGFYGRIDGKGQLHSDAPKAIILNTRILWTFSAAFKQFGDIAYKDTATRAFDYLNNHFIDPVFNGVYWMLSKNGSVLESKKQVYAQAFAIYALSEFHSATGNETALEQAISMYTCIENYSFDKLKNGYLEAFDREWKLLADLRLSDKDANEAKTMNTHLHVLEAYTRLYQVWPDQKLGNQLGNLVNLFLNTFIGDSYHFHLFFDEDWHLKSTICSYGHDIEGGWLLYKAAQVLENSLLIDKCKVAAVGLTEAALKGFDQEGGLMYEGTRAKVEITDRHWWPQAEALVGLINAFEISCDPRYFKLAERNWEFINKKLVDPKGEWHGIVHQDGSLDLSEDKAGPWKAPYHNGRAMLELMERLKTKDISRDTIT